MNARRRSEGGRLSRRLSWRAVGPVAEMVAWPALVLVLAAAATLIGPAGTPVHGPRAVEVSSAVSACPLAGGLVAAVGQAEPGSATDLTTVVGDQPNDTEIEPDLWHAAAATGDMAVVRQSGSGGGVAFVGGTLAEGGGLVVGQCPQVADDFWYVGVGTSLRHGSTLVLTNVANVPAVVDLELWGPAGPIDALDERGIVVEPGHERRIAVADLAVGEADIAVHVTRRRGAVTATMIDVSSSVLAGSEIMPSSAAPSRDAVVTGLAPAGTRTIEILNPGANAAVVTVRATGAEGMFVPEGLADVPVPAGTLVIIDVPAALAGEATALRVQADQPVVTSVRVNPSDKDFAYAVQDEAWVGPVVVPVAMGEMAMRPLLHLVAEEETTQVTLDAFDVSMQPVASTTVTVAADTLGAVDLAATEGFDAPQIAYVVITAPRPVHGAAIYRSDEQVATIALVDAPIRALGPSVRPAF